MTAETLQASQLQHRDHAAAVEDYYQRGWTDGLPVIPPEPALVAAFLDAGGMPAREVIGAVPTRDVIVTAEDVAINAVMAGCLRDAMELEWAGIPSVALVHEDMLPAVDAMTRLAGMPGYPYVVVDRSRTSLCDWDDATVATVATEIAVETVALLGGAVPGKDTVPGKSAE